MFLPYTRLESGSVEASVDKEKRREQVAKAKFDRRQKQ